MAGAITNQEVDDFGESEGEIVIGDEEEGDEEATEAQKQALQEDMDKAMDDSITNEVTEDFMTKIIAAAAKEEDMRSTSVNKMPGGSKFYHEVIVKNQDTVSAIVKKISKYPGWKVVQVNH